MVKLQLSSEISPAQEGFWTKLQHTFTSDSKSAHIIDGLIKGVINLKEEGRNKFLKTEVDFLCLKADHMLAASSYVATVTRFMVDNFQDMKKAQVDSDESRAIYKKLRDKLDGIRANLDRHMPVFSAFCDTRSEAAKKGYALEDKTFGELGFSTARVLTLAKEFRAQAAGNLATLRKSNWDTFWKASKEQNQSGIIGQFSLFYTYSKIATKLYSHIDYFLFYTNKKISKL